MNGNYLHTITWIGELLEDGNIPYQFTGTLRFIYTRS